MFSVWLDFIARLGGQFDANRHEEHLPFDPLSSSR